MPDNDDIEQEDAEEQAIVPQAVPTPVPAPSTGWNWVGSPDRPEADNYDDGISDLFEVDGASDTDDLVSVDIEKDIVDGDLSELTDVSEEDILGDELGQTDLDYKPEAPRPPVAPRFRRTSSRYVPPTSAGGMGG